MAKRRHSGKDEILVVPFLDILCSLIGVLILIIVVLCVSQSQQTNGRTQEEVQMSQEYMSMQKQLAEREKVQQQVQEQEAALKAVTEEFKEKEERYLRLRRLLASSGEAQEQNKREALALQKQLEDLMFEIEGLKKQQVESQKEIALLLAEVEKLKIPKEKEIPPVVVQPSGSGIAESTNVFFVECSGGALKVLGAWGPEDYRLAATPEVVVADPSYNHFLLEVSKNPNALVLFLIRDDGQGPFNTGAGRASSDYKIRIGKLPIPGRGKLDLSTFDKHRGKIPAPVAGAPAPTPPPATTNT